MDQPKAQDKDIDLVLITGAGAIIGNTGYLSKRNLLNFSSKSIDFRS